MVADPKENTFYKENYNVIGEWYLHPGKKYELGDKNNRRCRFCGKTDSMVTFGDDAHAIPELLGNKSITTHWECDECNHYFGNSIENDLGNWSKPMRTLARIRGKRGVPTLKKGPDDGWRIEYDDSSGFQIKAYEDDPIFDIDEESKKITFTLKRDSYTPVAVLKAFYKIALSLMPEDKIKYFEHVLYLVRNPDHEKIFAESAPVLYTFQPGPMPNDFIAAVILCRKNDNYNVPYGMFILTYGNETFQIILPSRDKDGRQNDKTFSLYPYPMLAGLVDDKYGSARFGKLDFTGRNKVRGETTKIVVGYDSAEKISHREP